MKMQAKSFFTFRKMLWGSIFLCVAYWVYLIFASQMGMSCDATAFEGLGSVLHRGGWTEYFKTGPHREPLYPFTIAVSMKIADTFFVPYYYVQKIIQVLILLCTQLLALLLLAKLQVNKALRVLVILYIGFSPALVNSAFSLFSEIAAIPFTLGIVLVNIFLWRNIQKMSCGRALFWGLIFGLLFLGATFAKGIFRYVFMVFIIPYIFMAFRFLKNKDKKSFVRIGLCIMIAFIVFNGIFISYKWMNLKYNGNFEFTDRYASILYGNAAKRAEKLNFRIFLAHLAYMPGEGIARKFFSPEEVEYCSFLGTHGFYMRLGNSTNDEYVAMAKQKFLERPFQYILFMGIESMHMFFWESTRIGFVEYPVWLQKLFEFTLFKNLIRLIMSLLTIIAFLWMVATVIKRRRMLSCMNSTESEPYHAQFFMLLLIISYMGLYSLFAIVTRYALPIAPLFVIIIACFFDRKKN